MAWTHRDRVLPRFAADGLLAALADSPVVLVHGPRQCGKTTLVRTVGAAHGYGYVTFDDAAARARSATGWWHCRCGRCGREGRVVASARCASPGGAGAPNGRLRRPNGGPAVAARRGPASIVGLA